MGSDEIHGFKHQIWWNPLESDEVHEILRIKSHEIQWGSDEIHEILRIKSYEIQWGLMKFMGF